MNNSWLSKTLIFVMAIAPMLSLNNTVEAQSQKNVYSCIDYQGKPNTVVDTKRGRIQLIVWGSDYFRNSGWTPQKRCQEVTARFQKFSDNKSLKYVTTGKIKNQPVICLGKKIPSGYECIPDGLLITLEANDNPQKVLMSLFQNATQVGGQPVQRSVGEQVFPLSQYLETAPLMSDSVINKVENETTEKPTNPQQNCPALLCD
jgi:hypothetical protein